MSPSHHWFGSTGHIHHRPDAPQPAHGRRGVPVLVHEDSSEKKNVTDALLAHATAFDADLLVMGAYGHSRVLEFMLGGTTQYLLEQSTIPVLISR